MDAAPKVITAHRGAVSAETRNLLLTEMPGIGFTSETGVADSSQADSPEARLGYGIGPRPVFLGTDKTERKVGPAILQFMDERSAESAQAAIHEIDMSHYLPAEGKTEIKNKSSRFFRGLWTEVRTGLDRLINYNRAKFEDGSATEVVENKKAVESSINALRSKANRTNSMLFPEKMYRYGLNTGKALVGGLATWGVASAIGASESLTASVLLGTFIGVPAVALAAGGLIGYYSLYKYFKNKKALAETSKSLADMMESTVG